MQGQTVGATSTTKTLDVDASDAPLKILHAMVAMPATAGAMTLFYPHGFLASTWRRGPLATHRTQ